MPGQAQLTSQGTLQFPNAAKTECCPCPQVAGCQCGPGGCTLACESRTSSDGFAHFCGFSEYVNPSNPPLYYLNKTLSGSWSGNCYGTPNCTGASASGSYTFQGVNSYDAETCQYTQLGLLIGAGTSGCGTFPSSISVADVNVVTLGLGSVTFNTTYVYDQVSCAITSTQNNTCVTDGSGFDSAKITLALPEAVLSNQDSVENAINRATKGRAWGTAGGCISNTSFIVPWGPGQKEFAFRQAQVQATVGGAVAGHTYQIIVLLTERAVGSGGAFTPYGQIEITITANANGQAVSPYQTLPSETGLEILASSCTATDVT